MSLGLFPSLVAMLPQLNDQPSGMPLSLPQYCRTMSLYVAQQLYRAFTLNFSAHSAPQRTTLSADNRDPTIGAGDRYNHYSHSRSLTERDRGPLLSIHQSGQSSLSFSTSRSFARPLLTTTLVCLASCDSSRATPDKLLRSFLAIEIFECLSLT